MKNYIIVGDLHLKYKAPVFRKETYFEELKDKINQINFLAKMNNAKVVCLGDFFNSCVEDYFELISYELNDMIYGWNSIIGNHDCKDANGNLKGTSFGVLERAGVIHIADFQDIDSYHYFERNKFNGKSKKHNKIALIHDYIIPKGTKEFFDYRECFENDYKIVFCGHYHYPFDVVVGRTRYINPGSLMRSTITELKLNRTPEVILIYPDTLEVRHIPLTVKPLSEVGNPVVENKLDSEFNSKFADMLVKNKLTGDNNDIIGLLKTNNVDKDIVKYIEEKLKEVEK